MVNEEWSLPMLVDTWYARDLAIQPRKNVLRKRTHREYLKSKSVGALPQVQTGREEETAPVARRRRALQRREREKTKGIEREIDSDSLIDLFKVDENPPETKECITNEDKLLVLVHQVQKLSSCFNKVIAEVCESTPQIGRVLSKFQSNYLSIFQQLMKVLAAFHREKERTYGVRVKSLQERLSAAEDKYHGMELKLYQMQELSAAKDAVTSVQRERIDELEQDVMELRSMIRGEVLEETVNRADAPGFGLRMSRGLLTDSDENEQLVQGSSKHLPGLSEQDEDAINLPLADMANLLKSFEEGEVAKEIILYKMGEMLKLEQRHTRAAVYNVGKGDLVEKKPCSEKATMTAQSALFGGNFLDRDSQVGSVDVIPVSPKISSTTMWWRAFNFARCPRCRVEVVREVTAQELLALEQKTMHGKNKEIVKRSESSRGTRGKNPGQSEEKMRAQPPRDGEPNVEENHDEEGVSEAEANIEEEEEKLLSQSMVVRMINGNKVGFTLPREFALFLANLPQTVLMVPVKPLEWLLRELDQIYREKYSADKSDRLDGMPLQHLGPFIIEQLLFKHGLKRIAELHLFELLMSLKTHVKKHRRLGLFARFLGAYHPANFSESLKDLNILQVILYLRHHLVNGPPLIEHDNITYVESEYAITVIRTILDSFLPPRKVTMHCRAIEAMSCVQTTKITARGDKVTHIHKAEGVTGDRLTVRLRMRNAMLQQSAVTASLEEKDFESPKTSQHVHGPVSPLARALDACRDKTTQGMDDATVSPRGFGTEIHKVIIVDLDAVLDTFAKILLLRKKYIGEKYKKMFVDGDSDGDGVLSFTEFSSIVSKVSSGLSQRKILRMFRDAVTRQGGRGLSITPAVFEQVCREYDVLPMVDFNRFIQDSSSKAPPSST